jgi:Tfp pilus assembly protein PilZ
MAEKRKHKRYTRRLKVLFGEKDLTRSAFTQDVSGGGCFIITTQIPALDARVHVQLFLDNERFLLFEGTVARHKLVPVELRQIEKGGFGLRFSVPQELVGEMVPAVGAAQASSNRFLLAFDSQEALRKSFEHELRMGGIFVRTDRKFERDAEVILELDLDFAGHSYEFAARVVHVSEGGGGAPPGLACVFKDPLLVTNTLTTHL